MIHAHFAATARPQGGVYRPPLIIRDMWQIRPTADAVTLQLDAERAGFAWACPFSSSAEFEAAVINSRRRAGAYRWIRVRRYAVRAAVLAAAAAATASTYLLI